MPLYVLVYSIFFRLISFLFNKGVIGKILFIDLITLTDIHKYTNEIGDGFNFKWNYKLITGIW